MKGILDKIFLSTDVNVLCMSWLLGSGLPLSLSPSLPPPSLSPSLPPPLSLTHKATDQQYMLVVVVDIMPSNWNNFTGTMFGSCINCTLTHTHIPHQHMHTHTHTYMYMYAIIFYIQATSNFIYTFSNDISNCTLKQRQF